MRIKSTGTFTTETLVDIAQRMMAELQDAGVSHVQNVNVYLNIVDKTGSQRSLVLGDRTIDILPLDCSDLEAQMPEQRLSLARAGADRPQRPSRHPRPRRATERS